MMSWQEQFAGYLTGMGIDMLLILLSSFLPGCFGFFKRFRMELMGLGAVMIGVSLRVMMASSAVEIGDIVEVIDTVVILGGVAVLTVGLTRAHARHRAISAGRAQRQEKSAQSHE